MTASADPKLRYRSTPRAVPQHLPRITLSSSSSALPRTKTEALRKLQRATAWARVKLPRGVRTLIGVMLMIGGVFGFLPVLGFWMIPLGLAFIALDVPPLRRRMTG